jgi:hypothetical protein
MRIVKVEYQVSPDYVETNKQNILKVMDALKAKNITSFRYSSHYLGEGKFVHLNITKGEDFAELTELQEFKNFQAALKASQPIIPPKPIDMELVGSNMDII